MAFDRTASRFLVPLGALLALGVAVGVWLVPSSVLDPKPRDVAEIRTPVPPPQRAPKQTVPEESVWMDAGEKLESRREPDPVVEVVEPVETPPDETTGGPVGGDDGKVETPPFRLNWEYEGMVTQPDRVAALIRIGGMQRFIFEGATLDRGDDPQIPNRSEVVLHKVERDRIILHIDGVEQEIERIDLAPPTRAPGPTRPGSPRSRRRS